MRGNSPRRQFAQKTQDISVPRPREFRNVNVNVEDKATALLDPATPNKTLLQQEPELHYTSESYQKILDYHVSEILLTTIIFGIILLVRMHH